MNKVLNWIKLNYLYVSIPVGAISLYAIARYVLKKSSGKISLNKYGFTKAMTYPEVMNVVLKGESGGYNDHNYYVTGGTLRGYVQGKWGAKYPLLKKDLSEYTIGDILGFQSHARDSVGQLFATGRYQIIPSTLAGSYRAAGLTWNDKYSPENQDKIAIQLLKGRPTAWRYLTKQVPDTTANLQAAALDIAKTWSSVGVPYPMTGHWGVSLSKNDSFYKPYDRGTTKTEDLQAALKASRKHTA
jgi:hypothetical protein